MPNQLSQVKTLSSSAGNQLKQNVLSWPFSSPAELISRDVYLRNRECHIINQSNTLVFERSARFYYY